MHVSKYQLTMSEVRDIKKCTPILTTFAGIQYLINLEYEIGLKSHKAFCLNRQAGNELNHITKI